MNDIKLIEDALLFSCLGWGRPADLKALEALQRVKARMEWQPIETAPKDGTCILVHLTSPRTGDSWIDTVSYNDFYKMFMSGSRYVGHDFITHWKHLDEPPEEEE